MHGLGQESTLAIGSRRCDPVESAPPLRDFDLTEILIVFALILANGVFAGAEIAIITVRQSRMRELVEEGNAAARAVLRLKHDSERFLATVQVGITVVGSAAAAFGGASIAESMEPLLARVSWIGERAEAVSVGVVVAGVSFLSIVVGELVPKSIALHLAERYALGVARPLLALSSLARPIVWFLTASANVILRPFGDRTNFTETRVSAEELRDLVREATQAATIPPEVGEIADRALYLDELTAFDVMVPRQDIKILERTAPLEELRSILEAPRFSRYPVCEGGFDQIVGYVAIKDLFAQAMRGGPLDLNAMLRPVHFAPESKRILELLPLMRREKPLVVVVDEVGGVSGIMTIEDVLEEFVGEILSEHEPKGPVSVRREGLTSAVVLGGVPVRDVNRQLGLELPDDGDWTTLAGYCLSLAGRVPSRGDVLQGPEGIRLEIVAATPRRILEVRISWTAIAPE